MTNRINERYQPTNLRKWRECRGMVSEQAYELKVVRNSETSAYNLTATNLASGEKIVMKIPDRLDLASGFGRLDLASDFARVVQEILGTKGALTALHCGYRPRITQYGMDRIFNAHAQT